ncbi:MAG: RtcB family protein [Acidimicrobiales bacterium]
MNCHHNFTDQEEHGGQKLWGARKRAIKASRDDLGVIPGSMGTASCIVSGRHAGFKTRRLAREDPTPSVRTKTQQTTANSSAAEPLVYTQ